MEEIVDACLASFIPVACVLGFVYSMRGVWKKPEWENQSPWWAAFRRHVLYVYLILMVALFSSVAVHMGEWYSRLNWLLNTKVVNPYLLWPGYVLNFPESYLFAHRTVDNQDPQWRGMRENLPLLGIALLVWAAGSYILQLFDRRSDLGSALFPGNSAKSISRIDERPVSRSRLAYYILTGSALYIQVYGLGGFVRMVSIALAEFYIGSVLHYFRLDYFVPCISWTFGVGVLFMSDYYRGFFHCGWCTPFSWMKDRGTVRWDRNFNLVLLRLISFNMDRHWAHQQRQPVHRKPSQIESLAEQSLPISQYGLLVYFAYILYAPLIIAGPVATFNMWAAQIRGPSRRPSLRVLVSKALGVISLIAIVSMYLAYWYAFSVNERVLRVPLHSLYGLDLCVQSILTLMYMYLKFMVIWRFFRWFALLDGVETHENMRSCVFSDYSFIRFWRNWHVSLHHWIMRYIYVPLGGSKSSWWSVWIIFSFVGLWHDLMFRWLAWALFNAVGYALETIFKFTYRGGVFRKFRELSLLPWILEVICASINIIFISAANLAIIQGFEGSKEIVFRIMSDESHTLQPWRFVQILILSFFCAVFMRFNLETN